MQKDDTVVVLSRGKLPFVLRRVSPSSGSGDAYEFMGDAFFYKAMAGERVGSSKSQLKNIVIV